MFKGTLDIFRKMERKGSVLCTFYFPVKMDFKRE